MSFKRSFWKMSLTFVKKKESRVIDLKGSENFFSFMDKLPLIALKEVYVNATPNIQNKTKIGGYDSSYLP